MSRIKIGINGMGRIGRTILREIFQRDLTDQIEIVAVNNPGTPEEYCHLIRYDSIHGRFDGKIKLAGKDLLVNQHKIKFFTTNDPTEIDWDSVDAEIVIDATGIFKDKASLSKHLGSTVKKVILCAPGSDLDGTFVMGINHETYDKDQHHIISNASCTTNCLAPIVKVLNDRFGIESGMMTTIHSYTSDQQILDGSHKDPRRSRAACLSMIPTTTGAAKAVGLVIPELKGKLDGYAVRVPTPNVSLVDLTASLKTKVTKEDINNAVQEAAASNLTGILSYTEKPLVSYDFLGMRDSSCVDGELTNIVDDKVKVVAWYDNEAGFSNRIIDLALHIGNQL
ncbi:MAG: type I glyceraldehyde-3-phosphate dehydrogenase [Bacteriovoracaceae bacterium]|jgi:glyceraldehyde 3-phosphate dehydrogenase|nr:type I glyceraldehyde-3-phosphate dehydrogenase [Bacteriovoracaceae bacterium]